MFAAQGLKICEWPEKAAGFLPTADLDMHWHVNMDDTRTLTITANTDSGRGLLA
jgi:tRNA threonylcarbamoyladenosine biosynthesis protein TsaE